MLKSDGKIVKDFARLNNIDLKILIKYLLQMYAWQSQVSTCLDMIAQLFNNTQS